MSDTSVHVYHSAMPGAPVLNGTAGSLIGVLDACLVNGWGTQTVDSIVIAGGIATVTRGAGHPFEVDSVAEIIGATVSGGVITGERRVLSANANTYTFDATGIPNQTATGTITHRIPPIGWGKAFSGTNLAAYRSADVTGTRFFLRVDDATAQQAYVRGYETMSGINTGTGLFPTVAQVPNINASWPKSWQSGTNPQDWFVIGNSKCFYLALGHYKESYPGAYSLVGFGDFARAGTNDVYNCFLHVGGTGGAAVPGNGGELDYTNQASQLYSAREYHGFGSSVVCQANYPMFRAFNAGIRSGDNNSGHIPFPNDSDGSVYLSPWSLTSSSTGVYRGQLPGFFGFPQRVTSSAFENRSRISGVVGYPGKRFITLNSYFGCFAFDVNGPWV